MAQVKPTALTRDEFIDQVSRRLKFSSISKAVEWVQERYELDSDLFSEALHRGLASIAGESLMRDMREEIIRSARSIDVTRVSVPGKHRRIEVVRSRLRDWPITAGVVGHPRPLEDVTVEEVEAEISHIDATVEGIWKRRRVLAAVVEQAKAAGVSKIGELPDPVLDNCLLQAENAEGSGSSTIK